MVKDAALELGKPGFAGLDWGQLGGRVGPLVRLLRIELTLRVARAHEPFGLHSGALSTLALVDANPGCSQTDLARAMAIDKSVLVAIVDDLERRGLARRSRSETDRRRNSLNLTDEGRRVMADMLACGVAAEQPIQQALGDEDFETLMHLLRRAYAALSASGDGVRPD